jgi:hypothetical protein
MAMAAVRAPMIVMTITSSMSVRPRDAARRVAFNVSAVRMTIVSLST